MSSSLAVQQSNDAQQVAYMQAGSSRVKATVDTLRVTDQGPMEIRGAGMVQENINNYIHC